MNQQSAHEKGLIFTGHYARNKTPLQPKLEEIRKQGYKAYIIAIPDSKYSRGPVGTGYSIYAEQKFFNDREAKRLQAKIAGHSDQVAQLMEKFNADVAELKQEKEKNISWLTEHGYKLFE